MNRIILLFFFNIIFAGALLSCSENKDNGVEPAAVASPQPEAAPKTVNQQQNTTQVEDTINDSHFQNLGDFIPSFYWIALEKNTDVPRDQPILDPKGNTLAMVGKNFAADLEMEGTGRLLDGRILNFAAYFNVPKGDREVRYRFAKPGAPYGYGIGDRILIPFRSIAVDPKIIALDSIIFIPQAKGTVLPDGAIHDGFFYAMDGGNAIKENRIDIFTSFGDQSLVFYKNGLIHGKKIQAYLYKDK